MLCRTPQNVEHVKGLVVSHLASRPMELDTYGRQDACSSTMKVDHSPGTVTPFFVDGRPTERTSMGKDRRMDLAFCNCEVGEPWPPP